MKITFSDQSQTRLKLILTPSEIDALIDVCDRLSRGHAPLWLMGYVTRIVEGEKGTENESTSENTLQGRKEG